MVVKIHWPVASRSETCGVVAAEDEPRGGAAGAYQEPLGAGRVAGTLE